MKNNLFLKLIFLKDSLFSFVKEKLQQIILPFLNEYSLYDFLKLYFWGLIRGAIGYRASAIAFSFFLAICPFLLFILNLIPYIPIENFQQNFMIFTNHNLPDQSKDFFNNIFFDITNNKRSGLLSTSGIFSIILMANGINGVLEGFSNSKHDFITRRFFRRYLSAMLISIFMAILTLAAVIFYYSININFINEFLINNSIENIPLMISSRWLEQGIFFLLFYIFIAILFFFGIPNAQQKKHLFLGITITAFLMLFCTRIYYEFIVDFSSYNQLYGSIGIILTTMIYFWINANMLLLGFELSLSLDQLNKPKTP